MTDFDKRQDRVEQAQPTRDARELPVEVAREVIQATVQQSVLLQLARVQPMSTRQATMPVLTEYPEAFWLTGVNQAAKDSALKKTTKIAWDQYVLRAEEIAVLYPIPDAYVADTNINLFQEIKPALAQAFGRKIDAAALFDVDNPWDAVNGGIYQQAIAHGNTVTVGAATDPTTTRPQDLASDIADLGVLLEEDGYELGGFAAGPGLKWRLSKLRSTTGEAVYQSTDNGIGQAPSQSLFGESYASVKNGTWDKTKATLIAGDWSYARVGIRQDMTFQVFDSGVISDADGKIVYNAIQQDGKILRAVMRIGFLVAAPKITPLNGSNPYPFAVLRPSGAPAS